MLHALVEMVGALAVLASIVANVRFAWGNRALRKTEAEAGASMAASASGAPRRSGHRSRAFSHPMCWRTRRRRGGGHIKACKFLTMKL